MKNENFDTVLSIAKKLEAIAAGQLFKCPDCSEWISEENTVYDEQHDTITCSHCGADFNSDDAEPVSMYDYFADCLDITYYASGRGINDYQGVRIMIACGGPNIYVDTKRGTVELYWWSESATADIWRDACDAIDDMFSELWAC